MTQADYIGTDKPKQRHARHDLRSSILDILIAVCALRIINFHLTILKTYHKPDP